MQGAVGNTPAPCVQIRVHLARGKAENAPHKAEYFRLSICLNPLRL